MTLQQNGLPPKKKRGSEWTVQNYIHYFLITVGLPILYGKESPGLMVMERNSCSEDRGFESQCHKMDGHF